MTQQVRPATPEERAEDYEKRRQALLEAERYGTLSKPQLEAAWNELSSFQGYPRDVDRSTFVLGSARFGGRQHIVVEAPESVSIVMEKFIRDYTDELNERLAAVGYSIEDLMSPTWMTPLRAGDVELVGEGPEEIRTAIAGLMQRLRQNEESAR